MQLARKAAPLMAAAALGLAAAPLFLAQAAHAQQVAGSSSGVFTSATPMPGGAAVISGLNTNTLTFGTPAAGSVANKFVFTGGPYSSAFGTPFTVGTFTYTNGTVLTGTSATAATLHTTLVFTAPGSLTRSFDYDIPLVNTPNGGTAQQDADFITLPTGQASQMFAFGGTTYTLRLSGFSLNGLAPADGFLTGPGGLGTTGNAELHVFEGHTASVGIMGTVTASTVPEPSSLAAFAATGLGALGLVLKARKRRPAA